MKKSHIVTLLVCFLLIPATLFLGTKLSGRSYYITITLILLELMLPLFVVFEGRKPQARELVIIAVLSAMAIAGRVAIPIPDFKIIFAIIMLSGIAFGPETGFMVGAISAFGSNFFYSQGLYTPWQMFSYGLGGMLAGFLFGKGRLPQNRWLMAIFGFVAVVALIGPIMDSMTFFLGFAKFTWGNLALVFGSGFVHNCLNGGCTAAVMLIFGKPFLGILNRVQVKYGLLEQL